MCGIAGVAALDPRRPTAPEPVAAMLTCLRHRGPDDEGLHAEPGIVLGHRRLAVIDVAGGHQPLRGRAETTIVVVNGEVYNFRELARELAAQGSRFRTASDSEVVAHAYDAWGLDFLERLDGMFALALWDGARRRLVLARDRMGEKPLYYAIADEQLIFSSELTGILAHPSIDAAIDPVALREYLALEYVPAPHCLVAGVHKLEPASALVLHDGQVQQHRYWSIDTRPTARQSDYRTAVRQLRTLLEDAVASRLVSDVPLGIFLSGGIDSSTVAALAARHGALETFAIGFDDPSFDERAHARLVARHIGAHHHEHVVQPSEMPDLVPALGELLDEPIGDASILPTVVLSRFARQHVTVALGGDGGDELFAGYPMHQGHRIAAAARFAPDVLLRLATSGIAALPVSHRNFSLPFKAATFLRGAALPPPLNHGVWMSSFPPAQHSDILEPAVFESVRGVDPLGVLQSRWRESAGAPLLARATHLDATTYLPNDILTKVDRASMAVALEVRAPLLARSVVEFAFSMPDAWRMRGLRGKRILRDAVRDLLPPQILARPKKGFGMPVASWLNGPLRELTNDLLGDDAVRRAGLFRAPAVAQLLDEHRRRQRDNRKPIWTLLALELWRRTHIDNGRARRSR